MLAAIATTVLATLGGLATWSVLPVAFGWQAQVIMSDSMAPAVRSGDVVVASSLDGWQAQPGQVVLFTDPVDERRTILHRVAARDASGLLTTRGDANEGVDSTPLDPANVQARPRLRVPWVGQPVLWARTRQHVHLAAAVALAAACVVAVSVGGPPDRRAATRVSWRRVRPASGRSHWTAVAVVGVLAAPAAVGVVGRADAAFVATSTNPDSSWTAAASFETLPAMVLGDGPLFYHRHDDAPAGGSATMAADATVNNRVGYYNGVTNGPFVRYRLDDTTGTTAHDASGNANPATVSGGATWDTTEVCGGALTLDGSTGYATSMRTPVATNDSFTVAAWVLLSSRPGTNRTAVGQAGDQGMAAGLQYRSDVDRWSFTLSPSDDPAASVTMATSTTIPATSAWIHLAGVHDASVQEMRLYVNGTLETTVTAPTMWAATGRLQVGRALEGGIGTQHWPGALDEVRVYPRALAHSEVANLDGNGSCGTLTSAQAMSLGIDGALGGAEDSSTAVAYSGTTGAYNDTPYTNPQTFTIETWFRATGDRGGELIGFHDVRTGTSSLHDRRIYLLGDGRLRYGINDHSSGSKVVVTVVTADGYNDGAWHHVVGTFSGATGLRLYLDGELVASDTSATLAEDFSGYWRFGGGLLDAWPDRPPSDYLVGSMDETAVYDTVLTDDQVRWHYYARDL